MSTRFCRFHYNSQQHTDSYGHTQSIAPPRLSIGAPTPRFETTVIRLKGRRTPHQDLKGPLIEITQPSISNQWATGGPPLVLISHPSGMAPDEGRFHTENRSTCLSPKLGLDGDAHLSPPVKKKAKGWRITGVPPLEDSVPESWTTICKQNKQEKHPHHKGPASSPNRGQRERITKGRQTKPNKTQ